MRTLRRIPTWGRCPQTPGIFRFSARMDLFWGAGCARPRPIPAAESALGLRSRSGRGRDASRPAPPAQIPTCELPAWGSYLG